MRSNLDETVRRRILADIGIDVWRSRAADAVRPEAEQSRPAAALPAAVSPPRPEAEESRSGARADRADASVTAPPRPPLEQGPADACSVLALSSGGVTLLLDRPPAGREVRLARDLLAAATGQWDLDPALRQFDWPPAFAIPGGSGDGAAERALRAFVEKELTDQGSTLVLLTESVAARLAPPKQPGDRLVIPDLAVLGRDSIEKRRIWARLGLHRLDRRGTSPGGVAPAPDSPTPDDAGGRFERT